MMKTIKKEKTETTPSDEPVAGGSRETAIYEEAESSNKINIKFLNKASGTFTTKLIKLDGKILLMRLLYGKQIKQNPDSITFKFKGCKMEDDMTPRRLGMRNGDIIEVRLKDEKMNQKLANEERKIVEKADKGKGIYIKVIDQDGRETPYLFPNKKTKMKLMMSHHSKAIGVELKDLAFFFDGRRITIKDSIESLEMEEDDVIEVYGRQHGGMSSASVVSPLLYLMYRDKNCL